MKKLTPGSTFEIKTYSVTAGVRGTKFDVKVSDKNDVSINVVEGQVYVRLNKTQDIIDSMNRLEKNNYQKIDDVYNEDSTAAPDEKINVLYEDYSNTTKEILPLINSVISKERKTRNIKLREK